MSILLSEVGSRGRLDLTFTSIRGRTTISRAYCEVPFKITRLHDSSCRLAHLILMHCTAGLFGGDVAECTMHIEAGARVRITQQSATKIHPKNGKVAAQHNRIYIANGAELHLHYEPAIPFAGSRVKQTTSIEVEPGGRLFFWEALMAGRVGCGELWEFDEFSSETSVRLDGRPMYIDRFCILPARRKPITEWTMRRFPYLGTGVCFCEDAVGLADRLHERLPEAGVDTPDTGLVTVRAAAESGPEFHRLHAAFAAVTQNASDKP